MGVHHGDTHQALVSQEQFDLAAHFMGENTKANGANPCLPPQHLRRHRLLRLPRRSYVLRRLCLQRRAGKYWYLVCNNLTSRAQHRCAWGAYPLR